MAASERERRAIERVVEAEYEAEIARLNTRIEELKTADADYEKALWKIEGLNARIEEAIVLGARCQFEGYGNPPSAEEVLGWPDVRDFLAALSDGGEEA